MAKAPKERLNVEALVEEARKDPKILVEAVRRLTEIARLTNNPEEQARIQTALDTLCGPRQDLSDPSCHGGYETRKKFWGRRKRKK